MSTPIEELVTGTSPPVEIFSTNKNDLQDSEMTPPTETGSVSEDEMGGWLEAIGSDFRNIAACFKDSTLPVLGGVASLVHRTAMSVAAEIAQLERDGELDAERRNDETDETQGFTENYTEPFHLPWEENLNLDGDDTAAFVTDEELMEKVLALSLVESTFLRPFSLEKSKSFVLDEPRIHLIRRLLDTDENLAAMHARLSGELR